MLALGVRADARAAEQKDGPQHRRRKRPCTALIHFFYAFAVQSRGRALLGDGYVDVEWR